ncbi:hypothetical protein Pan14r_52180 [Crateriforma conspicua]|uniref:Uncharacterized protein n=1 Tax=Crateriforma conspicua TaxID=2527996 RepID=A0A5C5XST8_9PLAN|nr:hypothetical protein Mal65_53990 [Crateriforma conspicua]TWT65669.1 hypothetical protein Pan14r_52180 [Crateriforma conspicua]
MRRDQFNRLDRCQAELADPLPLEAEGTDSCGCGHAYGTDNAISHLAVGVSDPVGVAFPTLPTVFVVPYDVYVAAVAG